MNKKIFENSSFIWSEKAFGENEYCEFYDKLTYNGGACTIRISVRGDYTLFLNGKYVSSGQYGDYEWYKVYDEIDISSHLASGENSICILVWYFGRSGMRYFTEKPGLIYEIELGNEIICKSSEETLSRKSKAYKSGLNKKISPQLGYSYLYDAAKEDDWHSGKLNCFTPSEIISEKPCFFKRPIKKHNMRPIVKGTLIGKTDNSYLFDLGQEYVGLFSFSFKAKDSIHICISYGELLENGHTKRIIGSDRDFSFEYISVEGENSYTNYMLRIAGRYIEIFCENDIDIEFAGVIPQEYPVKLKDFTSNNKLDEKIYSACLNTLKLCMMEHYVDCPWREQCLYAFDSRNQILAGYAAFKDQNLSYARANLILMSKDRRHDGLLPICFPSGEALTIPSFSLYYILSVKEYTCNCSDLTLAEEVFEKITSILNVFAKRLKDGLIQKFCGENYWDFYDWTEYSDGCNKEETDFLINAIAVIAFNSYDIICRKINRKNCFDGIQKIITNAVINKFYNPQKKLFYISDINEKPTELANSLAVISGIADVEISKNICERLAENKLLPCSLSMKTFKYDALIKVDKDKYRDKILDEIRTLYKPMLDTGTNTVWEVIEGASAFGNSGSLCHGWSAIPIYYYRTLMELD